ncbi:EAL domain-containing protein (putative c-di-GMP-specific phosphodiesterase class I) [Sinorhizobium fredii]|uniref:EAL domain-containing protein n=1 Tax=Sinorhizobium fredii (strain USDA 257) TaxID=1185652 RepID=I3X595_SINF2|nr:hypothetical protein USDA257_c24750 [Sinorhizobium fredii USDA 257]
MLQATVALANALQIPVTAEGIETERQATVVRLSGCDELQGYLFSRPVNAGEATALCCAGGAAARVRASLTVNNRSGRFIMQLAVPE